MVNRSFRDHLNFAYKFASNKNRLLTLAGFAFLALALLVFLAVIGLYSVFSPFLSSGRLNPSAVATAISGLGLFVLLFLLFFIFLAVAAVFVFMTLIQAAFQELSGNPLSLRECFNKSRGRFWSFVGAMAVIWLISGVIRFIEIVLILRQNLFTIFIYFITNFLLGLVFYFVPFFIVIQGNSAVQALKNSWNLFKTKFWGVLSAVLASFLSIAVIGLIGLVLLGILFFLAILSKSVFSLMVLFGLLLVMGFVFLVTFLYLLTYGVLTSYFVSLTTPVAQALPATVVTSEPASEVKSLAPREMPVKTILKKTVKRKPAPALKRITKKKK